MAEPDRPTGPISGLFYEYTQQIQAAATHASAEGHSIGARTVLESYDRTLHPWMHGRRPDDLAEKIRGWFNQRGDA